MMVDISTKSMCGSPSGPDSKEPTVKMVGEEEKNEQGHQWEVLRLTMYLLIVKKFINFILGITMLLDWPLFPFPSTYGKSMNKIFSSEIYN